ncbi:ATP-binding protein [Streptomyces seoulensis]|nr:ATP-binding protein [Streptomyces seoulensis]QKW30771.1 ATP-binding protein [Streptomyces seoulensis]
MLTAARADGPGPLLAPALIPVDRAAHFLNGPGLQGLRTPGLLDVQSAVKDCFARRAMLCLTGASGVGKTFATHAVLAGHPAHRACVLSLPSRPTPADLRTALHHALDLLGSPPDDSGVCDAAILDALAARPRIVTLDEAHQLSPAAFEYLRYLYDSLPGGLCTVLIAGEDGDHVLREVPMLDSRAAVWREIRPLDTDLVPLAVRRLHPLWQQATCAQLYCLDGRFAHGRLRRWALLTHQARRIRSTAPAASYGWVEHLAARVDEGSIR